MQTIRTLIVDDEPAARQGIRHLLARDPEIYVMGECADGKSAARAILDDAPDLLFLDVQMPGQDGFALLREVGPSRVPAVVFVTAYDQYALRAFEVHAVDYLLKPFDDERFREALARAKHQIRQGELADLRERLLALLEAPVATAGSGAAPAPVRPSAPAEGWLKRLAIKSGGRVTILSVKDIDWIEAEGDYVKIHVGKQWHLLRETMKRLESQLDPARFVRVHRSTIVNVERIRELQPYFRGEYVVMLHDGTSLKLSRGYKEHLEAALGRPL
jgi:two-component system LytT family response regulator